MGKISPIGSCLCTVYHNGKAKVMVIDNVKVKKKHRNKGVGTSLLREAINVAINKHVDAIELVVNRDNTIAKRLYEKVGFRKTNKDHYRLILHRFHKQKTHG